MKHRFVAGALTAVVGLAGVRCEALTQAVETGPGASAQASSPQAAPALAEQVDAEFQGHPGPLGDFLRSAKLNFPLDYAAMTREIAEAVQAGRMDSIGEISRRATAAITHRHRDSMSLAPDTVLLRFAAAEGEMLAQLREADCARFFVSGELGREALGPDGEDAAGRRAALLLELIVAGAKTPVQRTAPTENDWTALRQLMERQAPGLFDLMIEGRIAGAGAAVQCRTGRAFYSAVLASPPDMAARVLQTSFEPD